VVPSDGGLCFVFFVCSVGVSDVVECCVVCVACILCVCSVRGVIFCVFM